MTAFAIEMPDGRIEKLVVRRHGKLDLARSPRSAANEFALLQVLDAAGVAVPRPRHLDRSGAFFAAPCVVLDYVEGQTEFAPLDLDDYLAQIAAQLARIHALDGGGALRFLPRTEAGAIAVDPAAVTGAVAAAVHRMRPPVQVNPSVLLHGDFWPGNILWRDRRLVAVIDWEDASIGDPLSDLGGSRLEILWAFGIDAMRRFTERYRAITAVDLANLPYWDLSAALAAAGELHAWGLDAPAEHAMREKLALFIDGAFAQLPAA
jgi:aminoglycoside phosphotransferase (APT) family kinase protein